MIFQLQNLDRATFHFLPDGCRSCGWWQGHADGWDTGQQRDSWTRESEELFGAWGKLALADQQLLGMMQYGPPSIFPGVSGLGCGPPSDDAVLMACTMVTDESFVAVRKSLALAALAELQELEVERVEAFCHSERGADEPNHLFSVEFMREMGFNSVRSAGRIQLMRLELGGLERPKARARLGLGKLGLLDRIKHPSPSPSPATLCRRSGRGRHTTSGACV